MWYSQQVHSHQSAMTSAISTKTWCPGTGCQKASLLLGSLERPLGEMLGRLRLAQILAQHLVIGGRERGLGPGVTPSGQWGEREPRGLRFTEAARTGPVWELGTLPSPETGLFFPTASTSASLSWLRRLAPIGAMSSGDTESTGGEKLHRPHPTPFWRLTPLLSQLRTM